MDFSFWVIRKQLASLAIFSLRWKKWKLYQRKGGTSHRAAIAPFAPPLAADATSRQAQPGKPPLRVDAHNLVEKVLLENYAPACVIINANFEVLYIHGRTGKYLEPAAGEASLNLLRMAREGLRFELATAVHKVIAQQATIRYEGLRVKSNEDTFIVNLVAQPMTKSDAAAGLIMVVFEDVRSETRPETEIAPEPLTGREQRVANLERELVAKQEYLQSVIAELETANEELKSTNEEMQSANEELQSTNEELESTKEELQSVNEELMTVNAELQQKIEELSRVNNDMNNLLAGTNIGTIFVDHQLRIQRFTPATTQIINLIQSDVGRPVSDLGPRLARYDTLIEDTRAVLDTLIPKEIQVQTPEGRWYLMRIQPYRTLENVIEGAVLTFDEITKQKELQEQFRTSQMARDFAENVVDTVHEPLLVLDANLKIISASRSFYGFFRVTPEEAIGRQLYDLGDGQWNIPELRTLLEEILPQKKVLTGFSVKHDFPTIGRRTLLLNAREVRQTSDKEHLILLAIEDVAER